MKYGDYFCDYSTVEIKCKNGTDLTKLYSLKYPILIILIYTIIFYSSFNRI